MMGSKWRPNLRTRITIAVVAVAVGVAATTAGALVWNARSIILESKQEAIYEVLRFETKAAVSALPESPSVADLAYAAEQFSVPAVLINLETGESGGTLPVEQVPQYLIYQLGPDDGFSAYERSTQYGFLSFIAGLSMTTGPGGDRIGAFGMFNMQSQQDEIDRLVNLGALIGTVFVVAAAIIGLLVGRQLGRPLQQLVDVADGLGDRERPPVKDTDYPDVNAVLDAMRHSAERLDTTIEQLEQSEATARQLVADVAHELRTPLATLVAVSEILADTEAATAQDRQAAGAIAARSATHLAALTNDILEMSRFDSGKSEVAARQFDVAEMWRELTELRQWEGVSFELTGGPLVKTDLVRLKLIVTNLVTNALRHGEAPVEVTMAIHANELMLEVSDAGPGIAPEHADQVFHRFYKASESRSDGDSSGLGLAIVRENARVLGGDAWLTQRGGTVFHVRIPVAR
ncbi:sensor histidine kinase KdpD [Leucobacter sp. BZR 635]